MTAVAEQLERLWSEEPGLGTWLSTVDHKRIAKKYLYTALFFLVVGGIESLVMRTQLAHSNLKLVDPETFNQLFTMHGVTMPPTELSPEQVRAIVAYLLSLGFGGSQ